MKYSNNHIFIIIFFAFVLLISNTLFSQVGIGTIAPQGMLDVSNSNLTGIVFPKAILTSTIDELPVLNPQGGALAAGTAVFNTNITTTGTNDVNEGIYVWNGTKWAPQFLLEDAKTFEQTTLPMRVVQSDGFVDVPGLGAGSSFTPKFSGIYRLKAVFNFGAGEILLPTTGDDMRMATEEGYFRFIFNGVHHDIYTHAYSLYNSQLETANRYTEQYRHDSSLILYQDLQAGVTYDFRLMVDVQVANNFIDNGNSGTGRAYVGIEIPCSIEFTFQKEN
ncbi:MAG: hypothetical protein ACSHW7_11185 [Patiriisocius sp.]|uniref:hypothetical protein n=1 Tax=Patiriisocius sp. TaxID=2822396 RepID=UPI003EFA418E